MILVTWEQVVAIDQNGVITSYEVLYEPAQTFNGRLTSSVLVPVTAPTMNVTLRSLEEFLLYDVRVRANTSVGAGPFTDILSITTLPARKLVGVCVCVCVGGDVCVCVGGDVCMCV